MKPIRNPDSVPGDWYVDTACIDCGASRHVAPNLIIERNGKSVFARQPATPEEQLATGDHRKCLAMWVQRDRVLVTGDSLAWSMREKDLVAFRDACWYSWSALGASLAKLADYRFEWVLPGHGWPVHGNAQEMNARLRALVARMRES